MRTHLVCSIFVCFASAGLGACFDSPATDGAESETAAAITVRDPITADARGYRISVPTPNLAAIPTDRLVQLTVSAGGQRGRVTGRAEISSDGSVLLVTPSSLGVPLSTRGVHAILAAPDAVEASCGAAEFGIGCWASSYIAFCAGTTYCLPGDGPGGFTCKCV